MSLTHLHRRGAEADARRFAVAGVQLSQPSNLGFVGPSVGTGQGGLVAGQLMVIGNCCCQRIHSLSNPSLARYAISASGCWPPCCALRQTSKPLASRRNPGSVVKLLSSIWLARWRAAVFMAAELFVHWFRNQETQQT